MGSNGCPPPGAPSATLITADGMHCIDPANINKICSASQEWIPNTPPLAASALFKPLQHPFPECPFYRFGYQNFLIATQPDPTTGEAAIVTYPTIDDAFSPTVPLPAGALAPVGTHRGTPTRSWLGDIRQAGQRQIVIDQDGHTLYYGIHMNQAFVDFIGAQPVKLSDAGTTTLATLEGVRNADPNLFLPSGLVEFKTAWKDIDPQDGISVADNANYVATYVTTMAWIPTLSVSGGHIVEDRGHPRQRQMALVAIHVVYTIPGHPEFVWASFQHIDSNGNPDTSGAAAIHPDPNSITGIKDPNEDVCATDAGAATRYLLCKPGTLAQQANSAPIESQLTLGGADTQTFLLNGKTAQTSIYRVFPGAKSNQDSPDDDVDSLNTNIDVAWAVAQNEGTVDPNDRRFNYHLVGATWMDKPAVFALNAPFQNGVPTGVTPSDPVQALQTGVNPLLLSTDGGVPPGPIEQADERAAVWAGGGLAAAQKDLISGGTDSPFSILGGEERMSSTAMESYTQTPSSFFNCFQCHNTQAVTVNGVPLGKDTTSVQLLGPKMINVSHLFSQFVLEECTQYNQLLTNAPAACTR